MTNAATTIQSFARGTLCRIQLDQMPSEGAKIGVVEVEEKAAPIGGVPVVQVAAPVQSAFDIIAMLTKKTTLLRYLKDEKWDAAIDLMEEYPELKLAEQEEEETGMLPLHFVVGHNLHSVFEKVYKLNPGAATTFDENGRLPIHVAAEHDALVPLKDLLSRNPEGADTMILRPTGRSGGGIPLHIACKTNASGAVIIALLSSNFSSTKKSDANGDLPIHLLLRNGARVSETVVQALLDTYPTAATRSDMYGDLPLSVALKNECKPEVVKALLMHNPDAAKVINGRYGHSPLFLAFQHHANDKTILGLMNHAPELIVAVDKRTGMLPIEMATRQKHSKTIVHDLLKRDMPIDMKEKTVAKPTPHTYSWNHVVSGADDMYHEVVSKVLQQCTQPQVLALAHVKDRHNAIALATATPLCKYEFRVFFRLFHTLEIVDQKPAHVNLDSGTQLFYALRYSPPPQHSGFFTIYYEDEVDKNDYIEKYDDNPVESSYDDDVATNISDMNIKQRLEAVNEEKGRRVVAKLTPRSNIVKAELSSRQDYQLSKQYVPAIFSVHHTIQNAAYAEAMAEPGYCITMERAEMTAENLLLDTRKSRSTFPTSSLKSIAISLLHIHEHGLIHGDFGSHNAGQFGDRWKVMGMSGSHDMYEHTNPTRGFYHPPEAVVLETRKESLGEKNVGASVVSIPGSATYDIWAYGTIFYEALAGIPLSPYRSAYKAKRAMTQAELFKVGQWDQRSLRKALRHMEGNDNAQDLTKKLLHPDPKERAQSMREVLEHPFFGLGKLAEGSLFVIKRAVPKLASPAVQLRRLTDDSYKVSPDKLLMSPKALTSPRVVTETSMPIVSEGSEENLDLFVLSEEPSQEPSVAPVLETPQVKKPDPPATPVAAPAATPMPKPVKSPVFAPPKPHVTPAPAPPAAATKPQSPTISPTPVTQSAPKTPAPKATPASKTTPTPRVMPKPQAATSPPPQTTSGVTPKSKSKSGFLKRFGSKKHK